MSAIVSAVQPGIRSIIGSALTLPSVDLTPEQMIAAMFASGAKGIWSERSNLATLLQEHNGITFVSTPGQTAGLVLSKDKALALGSELWVVNEMATDWVANGGGSYTHTAGSSGTVRAAVASTVAGKFYDLRWTVAGRTAGGVNLLIGNAGDGPFYSANGSFRGIVKGAGNDIIYLQPTTTFNGTVSAISIRELAGSHQLQATPGARPLYQVGPQRLVFDGVDDVLNTTFPAALGASCTVGRAIPGTGAVITAGVNIGTSFADNVTAGALLIADRVLTAGETAAWTTYLNQQSTR